YIAVCQIYCLTIFFFFFFQAEDGIRDFHVTGVQTCALPILFMTYSFGNVVRLNPVFKHEYNDLTASTKEFADRWMVPGDEAYTRSEERRVGKECRSRWSAYR